MIYLMVNIVLRDFFCPRPVDFFKIILGGPRSYMSLIRLVYRVLKSARDLRSINKRDMTSHAKILNL